MTSKEARKAVRLAKRCCGLDFGCIAACAVELMGCGFAWSLRDDMPLGEQVYAISRGWA